MRSTPGMFFSHASEPTAVRCSGSPTLWLTDSCLTRSLFVCVLCVVCVCDRMVAAVIRHVLVSPPGVPTLLDLASEFISARHDVFRPCLNSLPLDLRERIAACECSSQPSTAAAAPSHFMPRGMWLQPNTHTHVLDSPAEDQQAETCSGVPRGHDGQRSRGGVRGAGNDPTLAGARHGLAVPVSLSEGSACVRACGSDTKPVAGRCSVRPGCCS
jgi:hypothetical protein